MHKLVHGIHQFQRDTFHSHRALFERLATEGQNPETLFITCSDSRVDPELITSSAPGDLFVFRNIGNLVPVDDQAWWGSAAAAIEYAVLALKVKSIVVCGHTQCGAVKGMLDPASTVGLPRVTHNLAPTSDTLRAILKEQYSGLSDDALWQVAVEENVLLQLEHLRTFPFVAERLENGSLGLSGWVYDIKDGEVYEYQAEEQEFGHITWPPPPAVE